MSPDLNLHPTLIDADRPDDLAWIYQADSALRPSAIDLNQLVVEVDWGLKRMVWVIYGSCHPDLIKKVVANITPCSRVILLEEGQPNDYSLTQQERGELLNLIEGGQLALVVGGTALQRAEKVAGMIDINLWDGWKPLLSRESMETKAELILQIFERIGSGLNNKIMSKGTYLTVAQHYLRNTLINAPLASRQGFMAKWKNSRTDRPTLVVSAGPSLNKQLPLLAENQDLFTIIAVDTVWPILHKHGIVPDALVALDRESTPSWPSNTLAGQTAFCVDLGCAPRLMWSHHQNHVITSCDPILSGVVGQLGVSIDYLRTGGSVATSAFSLAEALGSNPIVMIGQDLALTDGKDHAEGYPHTYSAQLLRQRTESGFDVAGYHGGRVRTERQLMYYKDWFEGRAKELSDRLIINATEGGAMIAGALQLPFATVCQEIRTTSLRKTPLIAAQPTSVDADFMAKLRAGLTLLREKVEAFKSIGASALTVCRRLGHKPGKKQLAKLDRLNQRLREDDPLSKHFVSVMGLHKFEHIRYNTHTGESMQGMADALKQYEEIYRNVVAGAEAALRLLGDIDRFYQQVAERGEVSLDLLDEIEPLPAAV